MELITIIIVFLEKSENQEITIKTAFSSSVTLQKFQKVKWRCCRLRLMLSQVIRIKKIHLV